MSQAACSEMEASGALLAAQPFRRMTWLADTSAWFDSAPSSCSACTTGTLGRQTPFSQAAAAGNVEELHAGDCLPRFARAQ